MHTHKFPIGVSHKTPHPPSQSIKMFGADFENDPGKIFLWGNINTTNFVQFGILNEVVN